MDLVDKYFKELVNDITFIELKEGTNVEIRGFKIKEDLPLPINTKVLVESIQDGEVLHEGVNLENIIDGIIYLMGIDSEFKYMEDYIDILNAYSDNIENVILYKGIKHMDEGNMDIAGVVFRALLNIDADNVNARFNYALILEHIFNQYLDKEKEEDALEVLTKATLELEAILDIDDEFFLAYYKLGYHYRYFNQYLKAKLIWEKYLALDDDEVRLDEVRKQLDDIDDDVILESGITYLSYDKFDQALDMFLKLLPRHENWWEIYFLIGNCYKGLSDYHKAIEFFKAALELNKEEFDIYNELGVLLFTLERIDEAVEVFTEGIEFLGDDYKLLFNRGLGYLQLGQLEKGYDDIVEADRLQPNDPNISAQKAILDELMEDL